MDIVQRLQIIRKMTGLTQEKLAQRMGVSFPTMNSWLNRRSIPHQAKQKRIDELYFKLTGQRESPDTELQAKKMILSDKSRKYKGILGLVCRRKDLFDQFMLSLTFHSNRIEGSTLTESETAAILFENTALSNKTMVEQLEVKNHQAALTQLLQHLQKNGKFDEHLILKLHAVLMNSIQSDAGGYRNHGVRIVGTNVPTANHLKVPELMKDLLRKINRGREDVIEHVSDIHSRFEQIHPFSDGNGRIGRLLIHAMLLKRNYPPAVIRQQNKRFYMKYLNKAQLKDESDDLQEFICDAVLDGYSIIEQSL